MCNFFQEERIDVLKVDNAKVRESQMAKLDHIKKTRDAAKAKQALEAITQV